MSAVVRHAGLPVKVSRWDLGRQLEKVASHFGLSRTDVALVSHYIARTNDKDYAPGRICAAWPMVCQTAAALKISARSINLIERKLERLGFIHRDFGGNGARSGRRENGIVVQASGINLAPLIKRYDELKACAEAVELHEAAVKSCRHEIRRINADIRRSGSAGHIARSNELLPDGRTARITDLERLNTIRAALSAVLAELEISVRAQFDSGASESDGSRYTDQNNIQKLCSARGATTTRNLRITPRLAMALAVPEFHTTLAMIGDASWPNVVQAASWIAPTIGIEQRAWQSACALFGREQAALCVIVIQRNAGLDRGDAYHAREPAKCLAGMMRKTRTGGMNFAGLIAATLAGDGP